MIITRGLAVTTSSRAGASEIERARKVASALNSPYIDRVEVERSSRVRRAKLYFLRNRTGKKACLREA